MSTPSISSNSPSAVCDLEALFPEKPHKITKTGLKPSPLDKTKMICNSCFMNNSAKIQIEKQPTCANKDY